MDINRHYVTDKPAPNQGSWQSRQAQRLPNKTWEDTEPQRKSDSVFKTGTLDMIN